MRPADIGDDVIDVDDDLSENLENAIDANVVDDEGKEDKSKDDLVNEEARLEEEEDSMENLTPEDDAADAKKEEINEASLP